MATTPMTADRRVEIGRIISRGFAVIGRAPLVMFGIAFLFGALPQGLIGYIFRMAGLQSMGANFDTNRFVGLILAGLLAGFLMAAFAILAQGALVRAVITAADGRQASFADCAATGLRRLPALLALSVLITLACWAGLLLIVVPGVILYLIWSVATPALVAERLGVFAAFGRSARLTKGARWTIFGLELIVIVFYFIVASVISGIRIAMIGLPAAQTGDTSGYYWPFMLVNAALSTIILVIWGAIHTSLYLELRNWKDGPAAERLADIFA